MRTTATPAPNSCPSPQLLICAPAIRNRRNSLQTKAGHVFSVEFFL